MIFEASESGGLNYAAGCGRLRADRRIPCHENLLRNAAETFRLRPQLSAPLSIYISRGLRPNLRWGGRT
jgi:hypothetical protein